MIVKNEAKIIKNTLANLLSVVPISTWVIHDTGSQDETASIINRFFSERQIPGDLRHVDWQNFGANRQLALEDATGRSDFVIFFDADCRIEGSFPAIDPTVDSYFIQSRRGTTYYPVRHIVKNNGSFRWRGVVHEGLYFKGEKEISRTITTLSMNNFSNGFRARNSATYYNDARLLSDAFNNISKDDRDLLPRYAFYAANSWRDAGCPREASFWYRRRIELGGWRDEVYMSYLNLGIELAKTGDHLGALSAWSDGHNSCPDRAECLYKMAQLQRERKNFNVALIYAEAAMNIPVPSGNRLFVWRDVYRFWAAFEFLWSLKCLGRIDEGYTLIQKIRDQGAPQHLFRILDAPLGQ